MENHVERLIASCGLVQFSYRTWPGTEILAPATPAEPLPSLELIGPEQPAPQHSAPEQRSPLVPPETAAAGPRLVEAPVMVGPSMRPEMGPNIGPDMGAEMGPNIGPNIGPDMGAAVAPAATRARTLLASLSRLVEGPQAHAPATSGWDVPGHRAPPPRIIPPQRSAKPRGPLTLPPPEGFEAPVHVGYRPAPKAMRDRRDPTQPTMPMPMPRSGAPVGAGPVAAPGRRFALLDELLTAPLRRFERRPPPPSAP